MFLIVIGYEDNVKEILSSFSFCFVYFSSLCVYRYEKVSTKIKLIG